MACFFLKREVLLFSPKCWCMFPSLQRTPHKTWVHKKKFATLYLFDCRSQWPRACWYCGLESHRGRGCVSVVSVVCCQVEVSVTSWSLVQRSPTYCCGSRVWSRNLVNEEALGNWGAVAPKIKYMCDWPLEGCWAKNKMHVWLATGGLLGQK
jgi:hypothetical protein